MRQECLGKKCFSWITYLFHNGKKLEKPAIRCMSKICHLDNESTKEVNKDLEQKYPFVYRKE